MGNLRKLFRWPHAKPRKPPADIVYAAPPTKPEGSQLEGTTRYRPLIVKRLLCRVKRKCAILGQGDSTSNCNNQSTSSQTEQKKALVNLGYFDSDEPDESQRAIHDCNDVEEEDEDEDEDGGDVDPELYWGPVSNTAEWRIRQLALRILERQFGSQCWVSNVEQGSYNKVFTIQFRNNEIKVCLKIPATGWAKRWTGQDAAELRREALTLRYLHKKLGDFPSPKLFAYDATMNNEIGAPFILMEHMSGVSATSIWYDKPFDEAGYADRYRREERRNNLLQSLAHHMAKLRTVTFPAIGVIDFDNDMCKNPRVIPETRAAMNIDKQQNPEQPYPKEWKQYELHTCTRSFFEDLMEQRKFPASDKVIAEADAARRKILRTITDDLPKSLDLSFSRNPRKMKETFSLAHDDLDLQNILCDEDGNVTAILDWERTTVRPHFLGWCTTPMWIRRDWDDGPPFPFREHGLDHSPVQMQLWRCAYYKAMNKELGYRDGLTRDEEDALPNNYTCMSHLAHALYNGLRDEHRREEPWQWRHFADLITRMIFPNTDVDMLYHFLAQTEDDCEHRYKDLPDLDMELDTTSLGDWMRGRLIQVLNHGRTWECSWTTLTKEYETMTAPEEGDEDEGDACHTAEEVDQQYLRHVEDIRLIFDIDDDVSNEDGKTGMGPQHDINTIQLGDIEGDTSLTSSSPSLSRSNSESSRSNASSQTSSPPSPTSRHSPQAILVAPAPTVQQSIVARSQTMGLIPRSPPCWNLVEGFGNQINEVQFSPASPQHRRTTWA